MGVKTTGRNRRGTWLCRAILTQTKMQYNPCVTSIAREPYGQETQYFDSTKAEKALLSPKTRRLRGRQGTAG